MSSPTFADPLALRKRQTEAELRRYEALLSADRKGPEVGARIQVDGWRYSNLPRVRLEPPVDWEELCAANRSWQLGLHSWDPVGAVLAAYDETRRPEQLEFAVAVVADWLAQHPEIEDAQPFTWYDMAVGIRAIRLAYVLDAFVRTDEFDTDVATQLLRGLELHRDALADDQRFAAHSNHGLYQVAGQLAMGRRYPWLPGMSETVALATDRLERLLDGQFASDGVHLEHSPGYHEDVRTVLARMIEYGLVRDQKISAMLTRIDDALAWFVDPTGELVTLGDTAAGARASQTVSDHPHLRWAMSGGREGDPPASALRAFETGGYAVVRAVGDGGPRRASHLVMACAFHSRTHKHADDLSFVWCDRGRRLLIDPGRYGYLGRLDPESELGRQGFWYSDPKRIYVESTAAHNTIEIDGRNYPRRDVEPYGSALRRAGEQDGIAFAEAQVRHLESILHSRLLLLDPGRWLIVLDSVSDAAGEDHTYVQRFHFARDLEAEALGDQLAVTLPRDPERLYVVRLLSGCEFVPPVRGQEEPELLGWDSPAFRTLAPCWTGGYAARDVDRHVFATLFAFGDARPLVAPGHGRTNATGRRVQVEWRIGDRVERVELDRTEELAVERTIRPSA